MEKFIPYEKLSKKEQQKINKAKRGTWGELNPVTRKPQNSKAYNRKRAQAWKKDFPDLRSFFIIPNNAICSIPFPGSPSISAPQQTIKSAPSEILRLQRGHCACTLWSIQDTRL